MISIILPTYNEKENITNLISNLVDTLEGNDYELIVVDDDSPDMTWKIVEDLKIAKVKVIRRIGKRGIASAIDEGIQAAQGDYIGWMDCDLSMPPIRLLSMKRGLDDGFDIVVGSRYVKRGKDTRPFIRRFTSRLFNTYARLILGGTVKDYDSGFILLKKEVFSKVSFPGYGYGEYFVELMYKCKGFKILELPYTLVDRKLGKSKTAGNIFQLLRYGFQYGTKVIELRLGI